MRSPRCKTRGKNFHPNAGYPITAGIMGPTGLVELSIGGIAESQKASSTSLSRLI